MHNKRPNFEWFAIIVLITYSLVNGIYTYTSSIYLPIFEIDFQYTELLAYYYNNYIPYQIFVVHLNSEKI